MAPVFLKPNRSRIYAPALSLDSCKSPETQHTAACVLFDTFSGELRDLAEQLASGEISVSEFLEEAEELCGFALTTSQGVGGPLASEDIIRIGKQRADLGVQLAVFSKEIKGGLSESGRADWVARHEAAVRSAYEESRRQVAFSQGMKFERRIVAESGCCPECVSFAARGWQEAGTFPAVGLTMCRASCRCTFAFSETSEKPFDVVGFAAEPLFDGQPTVKQIAEAVSKRVQSRDANPEFRRSCRAAIFSLPESDAQFLADELHLTDTILTLAGVSHAVTRMLAASESAPASFSKKRLNPYLQETLDSAKIYFDQCELYPENKSEILAEMSKDFTPGQLAFVLFNMDIDPTFDKKIGVSLLRKHLHIAAFSSDDAAEQVILYEGRPRTRHWVSKTLAKSGVPQKYIDAYHKAAAVFSWPYKKEKNFPYGSDSGNFYKLMEPWLGPAGGGMEDDLPLGAEDEVRGGWSDHDENRAGFAHDVSGQARDPHGRWLASDTGSKRDAVKVEKSADGKMARGSMPGADGNEFKSEWLPAKDFRGNDRDENIIKDATVAQYVNDRERKMPSGSLSGYDHAMAKQKIVDHAHQFAVPAGRPLTIASEPRGSHPDNRYAYQIRPMVTPQGEIIHQVTMGNEKGDDYWTNVGSTGRDYDTVARRYGAEWHERGRDPEGIHDPVMRAGYDAEKAASEKREADENARRAETQKAQAAAAEETKKGADYWAKHASDFKGMKGEKKTINIKSVVSKSGRRSDAETPATVYHNGTLAIHKDQVKGWRVTHAPTGYSLSWTSTRKDAQGLVHALANSGVDWNFDTKKASTSAKGAVPIIQAFREKRIPQFEPKHMTSMPPAQPIDFTPVGKSKQQVHEIIPSPDAAFSWEEIWFGDFGYQLQVDDQLHHYNGGLARRADIIAEFTAAKVPEKLIEKYLEETAAFDTASEKLADSSDCHWITITGEHLCLSGKGEDAVVKSGHHAGKKLSDVRKEIQSRHEAAKSKESGKSDSKPESKPESKLSDHAKSESHGDAHAAPHGDHGGEHGHGEHEHEHGVLHKVEHGTVKVAELAEHGQHVLHLLHHSAEAGHEIMEALSHGATGAAISAASHVLQHAGFLGGLAVEHGDKVGALSRMVPHAAKLGGAIGGKLKAINDFIDKKVKEPMRKRYGDHLFHAAELAGLGFMMTGGHALVSPIAHAIPGLHLIPTAIAAESALHAGRLAKYGPKGAAKKAGEDVIVGAQKLQEHGAKVANALRDRLGGFMGAVKAMRDGKSPKAAFSDFDLNALAYAFFDGDGKPLDPKEVEKVGKEYAETIMKKWGEMLSDGHDEMMGHWKAVQKELKHHG